MWNASYVQKHSIKPDRKSMKTRSEKNLEVCISTSLLDANRSLPDIKFGLKIVWKRHAGSWLSRLPLTKKSENCRYVFTGTLQRLPWPLTAMFPSGPLLEMKWDNATKNQGSLTLFPCQKKHEEWPGKIGSRSFTSFKMVHTHTHLLRTIFANSDVECNGRAKTPTINWHEEWIYIYIYIYIYKKTYNHSRQWPYKTTAIKYMSPPAASYMRPGAGLYVFTGTQGVSSLAADPLWPRWPPAVKWSFTSMQMVHTHTRQEWLIIVIRQELNPVTCKLDEKHINLQRIYTSLHYTPLHYKYNYNYTTTLHYTTLNYTTLRYITLHYTPLRYITLHYTPQHYS